MINPTTVTCTDAPNNSEISAAVARLMALGDGTSVQLLARVVSLFDGGTDEGRDQAVGIISDFLIQQVIDEAATTFGQFPMRPGGAIGDLNACLFLLPGLLDVLERHRVRLSADLVQRLDQAARRALIAAQRRWDEEVFDLHRDYKGYTNIFLLYVQALLLGSLHYNEARLLRMAHGQWQRWFNHVAYYGIDEFVSTTYNDVDYRALRRICACAPNQQMQQQARRMLDHFVTLGCAVTHPLLELAVCGSSRDYRRFLTNAHSEMASVTDIGDEYYQPPPAIQAAYRSRRFPYTASGRATSTPFLFQSWQTRQAALGSMTGGNYFWQQIHCMAAVGESARQREVAFVPGSYSIAGGYVHQQQGRALCVFARQPNSYHRTQKLRPDTEIADTFGDFGVGLTDGWTISQQESGRLTLAAYGHTVTIDSFTIVEGRIQSISLTPTRRSNLGQEGRFHNTPVDVQEWLFPAEPRWLGCLVQLTEGDALPILPEYSCLQTDDLLNVSESHGLGVRLFLNPAGGVTQLYEFDWRVQPLFACAEQTLWPGELAAAALESCGVACAVEND